MKKVVAALSVVSMLAMSAMPAMAKDQGFHGEKIKGHFNHGNQNVDLSDIKGHWAEKYILDLVKKGVLSGVDNKHFAPNSSVSRAEWAVMVSRYFGLTATSTTQDFTDVPVKSWQYPYVEAVKDYFDAYRDVNGHLQFHPNSPATRQDVTVTLVKILAKLDPSIEVMDAASADALLQEQFSDWQQINVNLRPYVATAVQYDLIHGDGKGHFLPLQPLSRGAAATVLDLLLQTGIVVDGGDGTGSGGSTTEQSHVTSLTTTDSDVVTGINNSTHALTVASGTTVATLKSDLKVDGGKGTIAVYTNSNKNVLASTTAPVTGTMVVVATAQDGTTQATYAITMSAPDSVVTALTTSNNAVVTAIDNSHHALTVATGTTVQTLKQALSVDSGKGTLAIYTDSDADTLATSTATVTEAMVVVTTAQDGTTQATYTIHLTSPLSTITSLTTKSNTVITHIDNVNHELDAAAGTTVQTLKSNLSVDGGQGSVAVYTDRTLTTQAASTAKLTNTMVLVATAQDGVTQATYTINVPTPPRNVTTLTTTDRDVVTGIDNAYHALTVASGTTVATLECDLLVDGGKGSVAVYTDSTKATLADDAAALTNKMVVVATAEDGTTKASYSITL